MNEHEYLGISLIGVIKELAGRVRALEEIVRNRPELRGEYERQQAYRAAYAEDEYRRLVAELKDLLEKLPEVDAEDSRPG